MAHWYMKKKIAKKRSEINQLILMIYKVYLKNFTLCVSKNIHTYSVHIELNTVWWLGFTFQVIFSTGLTFFFITFFIIYDVALRFFLSTWFYKMISFLILCLCLSLCLPHSLFFSFSVSLSVSLDLSLSLSFF